MTVGDESMGCLCREDRPSINPPVDLAFTRSRAGHQAMDANLTLCAGLVVCLSPLKLNGIRCTIPVKRVSLSVKSLQVMTTGKADAIF